MLYIRKRKRKAHDMHCIRIAETLAFSVRFGICKQNDNKSIEINIHVLYCIVYVILT